MKWIQLLSYVVLFSLMLMAASLLAKYLAPPAQMERGGGRIGRIGMMYNPEIAREFDGSTSSHAKESSLSSANQNPQTVAKNSRVNSRYRKVKARSAVQKPKHRRNHAPVKKTKLKVLPQKIIEGIRKFVFFVGNIRSGSTILGSLMDAHPHMLIANEWTFQNFYRMQSNRNFKHWFFNSLYSRCTKLPGIKGNKKGYTLDIPRMWQGKYDEYVEVIGDKSAEEQRIPYLRNTAEFKKNFDDLKRKLQVPIHAIQPVRNPFDMIATNSVISMGIKGKQGGLKTFVNMKHSFNSSTETDKFNNSTILDHEIEEAFGLFIAALDLTEKVIGKDKVLQVHNCDLIPRGHFPKSLNF